MLKSYLERLIRERVEKETAWLHTRINRLQKKLERSEDDIERLQDQVLKSSKIVHGAINNG